MGAVSERRFFFGIRAVLYRLMAGLAGLAEFVRNAEARNERASLVASRKMERRIMEERDRVRALLRRETEQLDKRGGSTSEVGLLLEKEVWPMQKFLHAEKLADSRRKTGDQSKQEERSGEC